MTTLLVLPDSDPGAVGESTTDTDEIASRLGADGVRFERWPVRAVPEGADPLDVYAEEIARIRQAEGYVTVDCARLSGDPSDPVFRDNAAAARAKFLDEHTHDDDEVRFFVDGRGAFYLRLRDRIAIVVCEAGDLISVPADTRHWFDMGTSPNFCALRFFKVDEGWVGRFTGDPISGRFPTFDELTAAV